MKNSTIRISYIGITLIFLAFGIISLKLIFVSTSKVVDGVNIKKFAEGRNTTKKILSASRGNIYSENGAVLAQNVNSYTVIAYLEKSRTTDKKHPRHVVDKEYTANVLSKYINMTPQEILDLLNNDGYQVELGPGGRNLSERKKQEIADLDLPGIDFISSSKRYYPFGDFASYLVGYTKKDDTGKINGELGVEAYYNNELTGTDGFMTYQQDAYGYRMVNTPVIKEDAESGKDIYLTIDSNVQMYLENTIKSLADKHSLEWATVTVANAKTGAILGSASVPSFDPNKLNITDYNNPLVSYSYEPGSTMKIFSFMAAINEGKYDGNATYSSGSFMIGEDKVSDWNKVGWGNITYDTGFTYSSNVAAANLGLSIGRDKLIDYYEKLGFGTKTGVEIANELKGEIDPIYKIEVANASFGQGIMTTPIQNIKALTSLANKGSVLKPYIVDRIVDTSNNKVIYKSKRKVESKVFSEETAEKVFDLMYQTVNSEDENTTGQIYRTSSTTLAGKTGTAQIVGKYGGYISSDYDNIRSFAGLFPYENPEFIIYISVKKLAAPSTAIADSVKSIVESIAKYKNLSDLQVEEDKSKIIKIKNYINKDVTSSVDELQKLGLNVVVLGGKDVIINQYPEKKMSLKKGDKIFLLTNDTEYLMPDMTGWTSSEVNNLCNLLELKPEINGYGEVKSQSIKPGDKILKGTKIVINLERKNIVKKEEIIDESQDKEE